MEAKKKPPTPPKIRRPKGAGSEPELHDPTLQPADNIDEADDRANVRKKPTNQLDEK
jgi:hypothetical protein